MGFRIEGSGGLRSAEGDSARGGPGVTSVRQSNTRRGLRKERRRLWSKPLYKRRLARILPRPVSGRARARTLLTGSPAAILVLHGAGGRQTKRARCHVRGHQDGRKAVPGRRRATSSGSRSSPATSGDAVTFDQVLLVGGEALEDSARRSSRAPRSRRRSSRRTAEEDHRLQVPPPQELPPQERATASRSPRSKSPASSA